MVQTDDGYEILFKGLESVRSDWSNLAKEFQRELYRLVFLDRPYKQFVTDTVQAVREGKRDEDLALRKRLRRKLSDYVKNVPPHVQAARMAEAIRAERGLPIQSERGGWISYLMTTQGAEPEQYRTSPIDYDFYVDRQLAPVADAILSFRDDSMAKLLDRQLGLF